MTYEQLKSMSTEERKNVLIELATKYKKENGEPDYKAIANAVGGSTLAIAGMYARDVNGVKGGRKKAEKTEQKITNFPAKENILTEVATVENRNTIMFITNIQGEFKGAEANERINKAANLMLPDKQYKISVTIEEV